MVCHRTDCVDIMQTTPRFQLLLLLLVCCLRLFHLLPKSNAAFSSKHVHDGTRIRLPPFNAPYVQIHDLEAASPSLWWILKNYVPVSFALYTLGFVGFVVSLRKKKLYRYQFSQFAYCHMALFMVVWQSTFLAANVFQGMIWMVLPATLVICNDIFAYVFGRLFGRTVRYNACIMSVNRRNRMYTYCSR